MDYEKLEKLVGEGYSTASIAVELGVTRYQVYYWLTKYGLKVHQDRTETQGEIEFDRLKSFVDQNYSTYQIADEIGKSQATVRRLLKKHGLKTQPYVDKLCAECGTKLITRQNKFCSSDCRADYNFKKRMENNQPPPNAGSQAIKRWLYKERGFGCEVCGLDEWMEQPIPIELHHIDGNSDNNSFDNLQLICPNWHALTDTYKTRNTGDGRHYRRERYEDDKSY